MDPILMILGVMAIGGVGGAIWLALGRGKLAADAAAARAESAQRLEYVNKLQSAWDAREAEVTQLRGKLAATEADLRAAEARHRGELDKLAAVFDEKEAALEQRERELREWVASRTDDFKNAFGKLSGDALRAASGEFLKLAEERLKAQQQAGAAELEKRRVAVDELVKPIAETLKKTDEKLGVMQSQWVADRGALTEQLRAVGTAGESLRAEASKLVRALAKPGVRGAYGETQLRRVAELAGMRDYCDFSVQDSQRTDDGELQRPDMVVYLPNERVIAVDAKTNIDAYLEAASVPSEEQGPHLERFAKNVSDQVAALSGKRYWAAFPTSPDFVVMFIPGEQFLEAALSRRPDLIEKAAAANVLLATPTTLIGLLRAVAVGWREKKLSQQAAELFALGRELHERAATAFGHVAKLGSALDTAVERYNDFVGSYERRLEPTLRKFEEAGAKGSRELPDVAAVDVKARLVEPTPGPLLTNGH